MGHTKVWLSATLLVALLALASAVVWIEHVDPTAFPWQRDPGAVPWQRAPNLITFGRTGYFYGSQWTDQASAACAPEGEWHSTPPTSYRGIGWLHNVTSYSETATSGDVGSDPGGSQVYVAIPTTMLGHAPAAIWVVPWEGCWVEYRQGPG